jgi:hypothetical protein
MGWCGDVGMWWCGDGVVMLWCCHGVMWWCGGDVVMVWCDVVSWWLRWCGDVQMAVMRWCGDVVIVMIVMAELLRLFENSWSGVSDFYASFDFSWYTRYYKISVTYCILVIIYQYLSIYLFIYLYIYILTHVLFILHVENFFLYTEHYILQKTCTYKLCILHGTLYIKDIYLWINAYILHVIY